MGKLLFRKGVLRGLTGAGLIGLALVGNPRSALATPGAHPALMSTSDTRASSVILAYRQAVGPLTGRVFSYNANFTSTGGILSAQFGAHVLQLQESSDTKTMVGAAATGAAIWSIPLSQRFDNGVPRAALILYAGGAPNAAVSGKRNFLNVPIGIGLGSALSPASWISITPWFEAAPGLDLDTTIVEPDLSQYAPNNGDIQQLINGQEAVLLSEDDIKQVISDSVKVDLAFEMAMRAGLDVTLRMSESWSFNVNSYLTSLGATFGGRKFVFAGAGLMFHWDDIVPAVLPPSRRLERESCDDIEARFRMCPAGKVLSAPPPTPPVCPDPAPLASPVVSPTPQTPPQEPAASEPPPVAPAPTDASPTAPLPGATPMSPPATTAPPPSGPTTAPKAPNDNLPPSVTFPEPTPPPPAKDTNALPSLNAPY